MSAVGARGASVSSSAVAGPPQMAPPRPSRRRRCCGGGSATLSVRRRYNSSFLARRWRAARRRARAAEPRPGGGASWRGPSKGWVAAEQEVPQLTTGDPNRRGDFHACRIEQTRPYLRIQGLRSSSKTGRTVECTIVITLKLHTSRWACTCESPIDCSEVNRLSNVVSCREPWALPVLGKHL